MSDIESRATRNADQLLDEYPDAFEDAAILRLVIAMAYLLGSKDDSDDTIGLMRVELEKLARPVEPQSLRA